ncbi:hypothetical protein RDWZM_006897 [Blomia tropicalis]|uniref:Uncharacterized protein n=1 Tax=Blomia tropicalis TaxID=40697 RepID=A0A9Q0M8F8_BLOTA|nr:hypothetical protein RDWZM_006897 [Blomia tropicalis]
MISIFVLASSLAVAIATKDYGHYDHSVEAPVKSYHSVHTYPVPSVQANIKNPVVDINSGPLPLTIKFNSHSSDIYAVQKHIGSHPQVQKSSHVDHPDLLIQNIKKPVIQEVREVITPYRHRIQEVRPVQEKIETIIAKDSYHGGNDHKYGHGYSHGYGHDNHGYDSHKYGHGSHGYDSHKSY